ncbi:hypothetical protein AB1Y20_010839 [Prymnesium parvum]|uniref:Cytoplasmic dynein 2 light intermediate chain 1 n=1 Tax=Prymnesium parvum TaxID=97485 RepID=A0AB34ISZ4_PRYPA
MAAEEAEGAADIFTLMAAQQAEILRHEPPQRDSELLFLGSTQSGKSTLVNSFLKVEENPPKPTTALEYRFARPADATGAASVCNVWELAGGTQLSELLKVVLLPEKLEACVVAITLDLSAPGDALETMLFWFEQIRKHVGLSLQQVAASGPGGAEKAMALRERANEAWSDHPDRDDLRPLGIPVMVFAHKWDVFEEEYGEAEYRKVLTRALRYFAHTNGASLMCTHHKDKSARALAPNPAPYLTTATPSHDLTTATPSHDLTTATPSHNLTTATPSHDLTTATPSHDLTTATPSHDLTTATPSHDLTTATPSHDLTTATPSHDLTTATPSHDLTTATPSHDLTTATPSHDLTTATPSHDLTTATPSHDLTTATPSHDLTTATPSHDLTTATIARPHHRHSSHDLTTATPSHDLTTATTSPPPHHRTTSPPPHHRTTSPPPRHRTTSPPPHHRTTSPPPHHRTTSPPPRHRTTSPPPHHRTTSPPPHHRTTSPPPHHRTTSPPPHHRTTRPHHRHTIARPHHRHTIARRDLTTATHRTTRPHHRHSSHDATSPPPLIARRDLTTATHRTTRPHHRHSSHDATSPPPLIARRDLTTATATATATAADHTTIMLSIARKLINHHVFDMPALKSVQLEHNKPLVVPVTADSFAGIGPPPQVEGVISDDKGDKWKAAFEAFFPAKREKKDAQDQAVMVDAEQFAEETVDDLRRAKQEELFKLRAQMHGEASAIPS